MIQNDVELICELSPMQQAMLFASLYAPGSGVYVIQLSLRLSGRLDLAAFEQAWLRMVERHGVLRTGFHWEDLEKPVQVVLREVDLGLRRESWRGLSAKEQEARLREFLDADRESGFALSEPPLMRLALFDLGAETWHLVWTLHHLLVDGWSVGLLLKELFSFYAGEPAPAYPRSYGDYIAWLQRQDASEAEAFWRRSLAGLTAPTLMAGSNDRGSGGFRRSQRCGVRLSAEETTALCELAKRHRLTLNTLVQGGWALVAAQATGVSDVVFGGTVAGRPEDLPGADSMVGLFINTLPVRVAVEPERLLLPWLEELQERQAEARRYEHAPLFEVQTWSELPPGSALFDNILVFESYPLDSSLSGLLPDLSISGVSMNELTDYPVSLVVFPGAELSLELIHDTGRFDVPSAVRLLERLSGILRFFASDPERRLADIPSLLETERHQALAEWNDTASAYPRVSVPALFAAVARAMPEAPALVEGGEVWSYRRLDEASSRLAADLEAQGVKPGARVGIAMDRSADLVVAFLGVLKAGAAYVPLDSAYPEDRLAFMREDTGAAVVLGPRIPDLPEGNGSWRPSPADALAYIIYTSGSTGRPKGVAVPHQAIVRLVRETDYAQLAPGDRVAHLSNTSFDAATFEIWGALLNGAAVVVVPRDVALSPAELGALLRRERVTALFLTTALFNQMVREAPGAFDTLRWVLFGGEAVDPGLVARALERAGPERLLHVYGPTESTTFATWHRVSEVPAGATTVPIGLPLANTTAYVLDRAGRLVPPGMAGELFVGGDGLAWGYWNRPELTAERFVPNPWEAGGRLYRTGDLVRQRLSGPVEFLGRLDQQVKIRGFRIEPGEIEAVLATHPAVAACAVLARRDAPGAVRLVAYVVLDRTDRSDLAAWLRDRLPSFMLPSAFVLLDALPLNPNGKVDRKALPDPEEAPVEETAPPSDPIEELLAGIWAEVLGRERVGVHRDFFELGGHSLLATQVASRIRGALGVELPLRCLFEAPTVAGLARLVRAGLEAEEAPPLVRVAHEGDLPLSFAQQRLWLIDQLEPESPLYNIPRALRVEGPLDGAVLALCLGEIVRRHEALRTVFAVPGDSPVQMIQPAAPFALPVVDLSGLPEKAREATALRLAAEEAGRPFDLARGPLLRGALLRLAEGDSIALLTMHHIVSDGWSMGILVREVIALYSAFAEGRPSPLPELPVQYADFAVWQASWLHGEILENEIAFWRRQLAGLPPLLELPTDRPRPAVQSFRGASRPMRLPAELTRQMRALSRCEGATFFMVLLAGFQALLARYSRQEDLAVGTPIAGRNRVEIEGLIGFFVNTLVLRGDLSDEPSFRELLGRVRSTTLAAYTHQDVPFEKLVEELAPERSLAHTPLFQVMFALQNAPVESLEIRGLHLRPMDREGTTAMFDLSLGFAEQDGRLAGVLEYATDLFDRVTIDRLAVHCEMLLDEALATPDLPVAALPLLTGAERHQLLVEWNDTVAGCLREECLHELFEAEVEKAPAAEAIVCENERLSYRELNERANRLAHHLRSLGAGPETAVALCLERGIDAVVAMLAVLKAGGAYLPLDPSYPRERLAWMLEDAAAPVLVTRERLLGRLPESAARIVCVDRDRDRIDLQACGNPRLRTSPGSLAYVMYTSGSTGRPRGVLVPHRSAAWYARAAARNYRIVPADRVLQLASISFDISVEEIYPCLASGATLVVATEPMASSASWFLDRCREWGVTVLCMATAFWHELAGEIAAGLSALPASVRLVAFGGEKVSPERVREWLGAVGPQVELWNGYGPTETTVLASLYGISGRPEEVLSEVPIGHPLADVQLRVLGGGGGLELAPAGVPGELCVGGAGVARGYLGRPDVTAERFVPDPFPSDQGTDRGARLYRTGDLARWRTDGTLEYLGRIDQQVKIRGFRVEPGEIEKALRGLAGVREAVVVAREDRFEGGAGDRRLVAYVVVEADAGAPRRSFREELLERLPDYMVPGAFVLLEALPLTPNGKVDRKALPAPERQRSGEGHLAPRTAVEEILAGIWTELLGLEQVGMAGHFFDLGGHSLLATRVMSRLGKVFGVRIPLRDLFEAPTLAGFADRVETALRGGMGTPAPPLVPVQQEGPLPLSFAQQRLWFIDQIEPGSPHYNMPLALRVKGPLNPQVLALCLGEIVRRHEALRTVFAVHEGSPVQVIRPAAPFILPVVDLEGLPEDAAEALTLRLAGEEAGRPFDLAGGPVLRGVLLRLAEEDHLFALTLHHIAGDGWSMGILVREVTSLYAAAVERRPSPLSELPVQYADFAVWQRSWLQGEVLEGEISFWRRQLADLPPLLELPTDRPRPAVQSFRGASRLVRLPIELTRQMQALSRREGATLFMVLLAGFQALLARYSGQEDLAVGSPVAGRNQTEIEGLIGFFVNTLVLRGDLSGGPSFRELLARVRETTLAAQAHQDLPFERLVQELAPERSLAHSPLFQVMFALQNAPVESLEIRNLRLQPLRGVGTTAKFDLTLGLAEHDGELAGTVEYATDLFDTATIDRLILHYERLLAGLADGPERSAEEIGLLTAEEALQLAGWNATARDYPSACVHELLAEQAERAPDTVAVDFGDQEMTYRELLFRSRCLARRLRRLGVCPGSLVGLCTERSPEMVVGMLGILTAGGAYVPLDPGYPEERLAFLLEDTGTGVLVTQEHLAGRLPTREGLRVEALEHAVAEDPGPGALDFASLSSPDDPAYVIYTSGSTGRPKGVVVSHRAIVRLVSGTDYVQLGPEDRVAQAANSSFDAATFEVWGALLNGGRLVGIEREVTLSPRDMVSALDRGGITALFLTTALFNQIAREEPRGFARLRTLLFGGEMVDPAAVLAVLQNGPPENLLHVYGPTETTTFASWHRVESVPPGATVPIGRPLANGTLDVLDRGLHPLPVGVPGELYVGGDGLAYGYHARPELTAERFVPHPRSGTPGARLYRTGDLVRRRPDGGIEILGRLDHQVKIRGFRVEPGEIETTLLALPGVREALVIAREDRPGDRRLVAYVTGGVAAGALRSSLSGRLPDYMVPAAFVVLDALPLNPNGKVDRKALPAPDGQSSGEGHLPPRTPVEEVLAGIWAELLGLERVGVADHFFELGGHSLLATRMMSRLRAVFGVELPLRDLFEAPTLADLAARVESVRTREDRRSGAAAPAPPLVPVPRTGPPPLWSAQLASLPVPEPTAAGEDYLPPRTPVEEVLAGIWAELLGRGRIGADGHFFDLGGHSLLAARVMSRLREAFGVEMPLRDLFEAPVLADLATRIEAALRDDEGRSLPPLVPVPSEGSLPLSFAQQRLWFIDRLEPGSALYNMPVVLRVEGPLDPGVLARSLSEIVRRHEVLRTVFAEAEGVPVQVVRPATPFALLLVDLSGLPPAAREAAALALTREEAERPFDLARGPVVRGLLLRLAGEGYVAALTLHHIAGDGWSMGVLVREIATLYTAFAAGRPSLLPELPVQYADFAVWQRSWLQGEVLEHELSFWRRQLAGLPPRLELPTDRPRPSIQSFRGASRQMRLSAGLTRQIGTLSRREGTTLFMVLLAGFHTLLARSSGQNDLSVGSPVAGRNRMEIEGLIGFFVNTLVLRGDLSGVPSFRELLARVRETTLAAHAHQDLPFERLVEELAPERSLAQAPLFQVMLALQNAPIGNLEIRNLRLRPLAGTIQAGTTAKFDLTLAFEERGGELVGAVEYASDLFDATTIDRLCGHFERLLAGLAGEPERPVHEIGLLTPVEALQLMGWNATAREYPQDPVHELFARQAERSPDSVAVTFGDRELTYRELLFRSRCLAQRLRHLGVCPGSLVGLCTERSPEMVIGMLGILTACGAYVPLDPAYPEERLSFMLEDTGTGVLVTQEHLAGRLPTREGLRVEILEHAAAEEPGPGALDLASVSSPGDPAYVIYTSGSTGRPKGVVVPHRAVIRLVRGTDYVHLGPEDRVAQAANSSFDAATFEVWGALLNGARLVGIEREVTLAPRDLVAALDRERISALFLTTALFNQVAREEPGGFARLRYLLFGGELVDPAAVQAVLQAGPPEHLLHVYGPTETTTFASWHRVKSVPPGETVPIGRPLANGTLEVLDRGLLPLPVGVPGELYVGGDGLAHGYHARPELTAERFVPHPLPSAPGARLYRTGDLVRRRPDGAVEFLGRLDHQVKIRGFRVEPGEIEAALAALPGVREAVVIAREDRPGDRRLVAYVTGSAAPDALRGSLSGRLPDYMVPAAFVALDALPLNPNGKVDRKALPAPDRQGSGEGRLAPRTPVEEVLAGIWCEVLGLEQVGIADRFFDLGGHSLLATRVLSRVREAFQVELPLRDLFEAAALSDLAARIETVLRDGAGVAPPLVPVPRNGLLPLSFAQERFWVLDRLEPGNPAYNMPGVYELAGPLDVASLAAALGHVASRHEVLRTVFRVTNGAPRQHILPPFQVVLPVLDLAGLPEEVRRTEARRLAVEHALHRFDLARGPLLDAILLRLAPDLHRFLLVLHHAICDGWSLSLLVREVGELYAACAAGRPPALGRLPVQYADFAVWQRELVAASEQAELSWWLDRLAGEIAPLEMPADRMRPAVQTYRGGRSALVLPAGFAARLAAFGRAHGATLFMTLLAAIQALLHRHSGQDDILVGAPVAGRRAVETEILIGCFLNTLALRTDLGGEPGFRELVARVREVTLGAYSHQDVPFEAVLASLPQQRDLSRTPLFQVMVNLLNLPATEIDLPGLALEGLAEVTPLSKFDMTFYVRERDGVHVDLVYNADLFDAARMEDLLAQLETFLDQALDRPDEPIGAFSLLTAGAGAVLPDPAAPLPPVWPGAVHELFAERARQHPDRPAVTDRDGVWSYGDLAAAAHRLCAWLEGRGVLPGDRVAVYAHRSAPLAPALLGTLGAGAAFTVLDPAYPAARLITILDVTAPRAFLRLEAAGALPVSIEEWLRSVGCPILALPGGGPTPALERLAGLPEDSPGRSVGPDDLAWVSFTSGSTGVPKGVLGSHRPLSHFIAWHGERFGLAATDRFSLLAGLAHDPLLRDLFTPLCLGALLAIPQPEELTSPDRFACWMREQGITVAHLTPALGEVLTEAPGETLGTLRFAFFGGDVLTRRSVERLRGMAPGCACVNYYGATETPQGMGFHEVSLPDRDRIPLGRGIDGVQLLVLNAADRLAGVGELGEICIRTPYLALGYLGDEALTRERFTANPFTGAPDDRLYRTGDLGRYLANGAVDLQGRRDAQVKIRGFRIEPGEIEAALLSLPGIREAVVLAREERLVAYVVGDVVADALRQPLRERLPEHLVPAAFVTLAALPLTPNGKVDRRALPAPEQWRGGEGYLAPRTPVEEVLAGLWAELLGLERVGAADDFFALGGHSLLATRVVAAVRDVFRVDLPLRLVFERPTVEGLAQAISEAGEAGAPVEDPIVPIPREPGVNRFPVSFSQLREWILDRLEPGTPAYNIASPLRIEGPLSVPVLSEALQGLVRRHEVFRTAFLAGPDEGDPEPLQAVLPEVRLDVPVIDLSALPESVREGELRRRVDQEEGTGFDLSAAPLLRARVVRLTPDDHALLLTVHHIVSDGWSMSIFHRELAAFYETVARTSPPPVPSLRVQYADYAVWQRWRLSGELLQRQAGFWRRELAGAPPLLELPTDRPRPPVRSSRGGKVPFLLPQPLAGRLEELARRRGASLFMILLAGYQSLLARWSGQDDVVVGTYSGNRPRRELEGLIGFFINTLVLRTHLTGNAGDPSFSGLVRRVRETTLEAYAHRDIPFEKLLEILQVPRDPSRTPLFQALLVLQSFPPTRADLSMGVRLRSLAVERETSDYDLALWLSEGPDGIGGTLQYSTDLFDEATIVRFAGHLRTLLEAAVADPERNVWTLPLISREEQALQLATWSRGPDVPAGSPLLHRLVEEQAARTPDAVAVEAGSFRLTYAELVEQARRFAEDVAPGTIVALTAMRKPELIAQMLGVLQAGAAYLPVDPAYPRERRGFMLADSGAKDIKDFKDINDSATSLVSLPTLKSLASSPGDAAYVIYTSGSTGRPKGVLVPHQAIASFVRAAIEDYSLTPGDRVLQLASISFDTSAEEIWPALASGATLVLRPDDMMVSIPHFLHELERLDVTVLDLPTAFWHEMVSGMEAEDLELPRGLRLVILGGEEALADRFGLWHRRIGSAVRLVNTYGPTEATIVATRRELSSLAPGRTVPIGRPIPGARAYLLDRFLVPVPPGVRGELWIGGGGVARGYLGQPALTAERFTPDPFADVPGERLYRTGDLAVLTPDGDLVFAGRADRQLKIRGYRIEPGEIEAALRLHPAVRDAVVDARGPADGRRLIAWIVPHEGIAAPEISGLRELLRGRLPEPLVPAAFAVLPPASALPLTPSGKVDRRALPQPAEVRSGGSGGVPWAEPQSAVERVIAEIYRGLLRVDRVGLHDNFFDLGGHSLLIVRAHQKLKMALGREIPVLDLFRFPTVAALARSLGGEETGSLHKVRGLAHQQRAAQHRQKAAMDRLRRSGGRSRR